MSSGWFDRLCEGVEARGWSPVVMTTEGGRLLAVRENARLLGVEVAGAGDNGVWHDPAFEDPKGSGPISGGGGDRLWIAPEVAYYWPSLELARKDAGKYAILPADVDPGRYAEVSSDAKGVAYGTTATLKDHRVGVTIAFEVLRTFRLCEPLAGLGEGVTCLSYAMENRLTLGSGDFGAVAGAWSICQVPTGGVLHCPTVREALAEVTSYYEPFGERVTVDGDGVRFRVDGLAKIKMGIAASATSGRMGYYRETEAGALLMLRAFPSLPGEPYVDVPISAESKQRYGRDVLQAYNHDGGPETFGEMEYHDPALVVGRGPEVRSGVSVTHAVFGEAAKVRAVGEAFLGMRVG
ncbi:DUF6786 family protein [Mucisphaera sp.]|uniref:DUF6786 family protein n=1 Tax=Mucisphaera sp. TaxID=2913024 RepID=UPI003D0F2D8A